MKKLYRSRLMMASILSTALMAPMAYAQEAQNDEAEADADDRIVVTGSRLRRDEFSSISPVQVINADEARQLGIVDTTAMIAQSPVVSGTQLDGSINSGSPTAAVEGVPANGPGASTVALRGLGAERTLLLLNGRRISPSGVRGAPIAPDLNLIPSAMIERVDLLTDGASSIYGADAVAGVANIILRSEVEGMEFSGFVTQPEEDGGEVQQWSLIGGMSGDRGHITVAGEFFNRTAVLVGDRSDWNNCLRDIDVDTEGNTHSVCMDRRPDSSALILSTGFVFATPGATDIGIPGWSTGAGVLSATGEHFFEQDVYSLQDEERTAQLLENVERMNFMTSGEYDVDWFSRDTVFFELLYSTRNSVGRFPSEQIFPGVPGSIPMENGNGGLMQNPDGSLMLFDNPLNPFDEDALPVYTTQGLNQRRVSDVAYTRFLGGLEGDFSLTPFFAERNWVYEVAASYDRSYGTASQAVMNENAVRESLDTLRFDANGDLVCGLDRTSVGFGFLTPQDCVVVNFFADSLFSSRGGDGSFATQAEEDFLFGSAINVTEIEQVHFQSIITGDLFEMPAGTVGLVLGGEFRENRINSINSITRVQGLGASEIPDTERPTVGRTSIYEFFAETELPITSDFLVNLSGRFTEEENFGANVTYSVKADWQATDWLRLRGSFGTTFRAPNLREQFLAGSTGTIGGGNDPCLVPLTARDANGNYDPNLDDRSQLILDNCVQSGADPTALGLQATTGITTSTGGNPNAQAETSESLTVGAIFSRSFGEVDVDVSVNYFDITVEDTLREASPAEIIANCFTRQPNLQDPDCARVTRNTNNPPAQATIALVDASFINVGELTSQGFDYNVRVRTPLRFIDDQTDLTLNFVAQQHLENQETVDPDDPNSLPNDFVGEIGTPEWRANFTAGLVRNNWSVQWRTRYLGEGQQDNSDTFRDFNPTGTGTACDLLGVTLPCRDVDFIDDYITHDLSLSYVRDEWSATLGINNLFDEEPPLIDQGEGPSRHNIVTQSGHDLIGRRVFASVNRRF